MSTDRLKNVGPKSAAWLRQVGVRTMDDLAALGAVAAFIKVKRAGFKPSLNLLYALEGALIVARSREDASVIDTVVTEMRPVLDAAVS